MWIKICANTNLDDAQMAAKLGADALGFVFAPSKRQVTADAVARITPHLPQHVERVGVFHSQDPQEIAHIVREAGLTAVQLHGGLDPDLPGRLNALFPQPVKIIQTLHWQVDEDGASAATIRKQLAEIARDPMIDRVLVDSKVGSATGGTGVSFPWSTAKAALTIVSGPKLIVAGGLRPENVAEAIRELNPWGVDVASGVESEPGKKDAAKLAAFIRNARS